MTAPIPTHVIKQHLIDPEICIRCNTCEETCPIDAITHDSNNYVVNPEICNSCMACVPPCPTGAIDNWLKVLSDQAYGMDAQFGWNELPAEQALDETPAVAPAAVITVSIDSGDDPANDLQGMPST
jgi:benzoyl-CoA 2,3-dioxygenase component A